MDGRVRIWLPMVCNMSGKRDKSKFVGCGVGRPPPQGCWVAFSPISHHLLSCYLHVQAVTDQLSPHLHHWLLVLGGWDQTQADNTR